MSHNGLHNGIYEGLYNGLENGFYNGLLDGITSPNSEQISFIFDPDALDFFNVAGITLWYQKIALNRLVLDLKNFGIWAKLLAIYPMLGGTASTHKWNLKDRRDLDAAFRLAFFGGWVHSSTGAKPDGSTGYANTFLNPTTHMTSAGRGSLSYYSRTNSSSGIEMGVWVSGAPNRFVFATTNYLSHSYLTINGANSGTFTFTSTRGDGFVASSRTGTNNTNTRVWNIARKITGTTSNANVTPPNGPVYLGARKRVGFTFDVPSDKECAFASIGASALSYAELDNLEKAVNTYQTALSRNVY